jgi:hypothetical protein
MGAEAFAAGDHVAFAGSPSLHTAAHEAAHVVQQRGGVQLKGGVGESGDVYEKQADAVADAVVAGKSAEGLLGAPAAASTSADASVQRKEKEAPKSANDKSHPQVPTWEHLPDYVQQALGSKGIKADWYDKTDTSDDLRVTLLTLYVKLKGLGFWEFVGTMEESTSKGQFEFACTDVHKLKDALRKRDDFTSPEQSDKEWSSREMRGVGQLHFKHFDKWPVDKVQAHIDQVGPFLHNPFLRVLGIIPFGIGHLIDDKRKGWQQPEKIREILLEQGWDPTALKGK